MTSGSEAPIDEMDGFETKKNVIGAKIAVNEGGGARTKMGEGGGNLSGELEKESPMGWGEFGPTKKSGKIAADLVGSHVAVRRKARSFAESGGVPEVGVNLRKTADGRGELLPRKAVQLIYRAGGANFLEKEQTVGSVGGSQTTEKSGGKFALKGGK